MFIGLVFKAFSGVDDAAKLTSAQRSTIQSDSLVNGAVLGTIACIVGIGTFFSGYLMGKAGENLTMRLRLAVYKVSDCDELDASTRTFFV